MRMLTSMHRMNRIIKSGATLLARILYILYIHVK